MSRCISVSIALTIHIWLNSILWKGGGQNGGRDVVANHIASNLVSSGNVQAEQQKARWTPRRESILWKLDGSAMWQLSRKYISGCEWDGHTFVHTDRDKVQWLYPKRSDIVVVVISESGGILQYDSLCSFYENLTVWQWNMTAILARFPQCEHPCHTDVNS